MEKKSYWNDQGKYIDQAILEKVIGMTRGSIQTRLQLKKVIRMTRESIQTML